MLQGCARHEMFEQEIELLWDAHESIDFEAKELKEHVTPRNIP